MSKGSQLTRLGAMTQFNYRGSRGLDFNYTLWGSPNLAGLMAGQKGRYLSRFDLGGRDNFFDPETQIALLEASAPYQGRIADKFTERHGRTGDTVGSERGTMERDPVQTAGAFTYHIEWRGGVGFVINPLPPHMLGMPPDKPAGPWEGRTTNFYSPTDRVSGDVEWYQGGEESFSPDTSWFDEDKQLIEDARAALARVGARAQLMWGAQAGQLIPLAYPRVNPGPYVGPWL